MTRKSIAILAKGTFVTYAEHDLQAFRDRVYVTTGARLTLTDAAVELDRIRGLYAADPSTDTANVDPKWLEDYTAMTAGQSTLLRMADDYFQPVDP